MLETWNRLDYLDTTSKMNPNTFPDSFSRILNPLKYFLPSHVTSKTLLTHKANVLFNIQEMAINEKPKYENPSEPEQCPTRARPMFERIRAR